MGGSSQGSQETLSVRGRQRQLTADKLSTHLVEVEPLLNSTPIASPGNDHNDKEAHLLIGQPESETSGICNKVNAIGDPAAVLTELVQGLPGQPAANGALRIPI